MKKYTKEELLNHYSQKEPNPFFQFDAYYGQMHGDYPPDKDNDFFMEEVTVELMGGIPHVRVLVTPKTSPEVAARQLEKIAARIRKYKMSVHRQEWETWKASKSAKDSGHEPDFEYKIVHVVRDDSIDGDDTQSS
ncbi:MAG: hypothetical protein ACYS8W_17940 [Planctomycetota bacterium]|jgi:hypothetical protein